jgi:hypothetical protein
VDIKPGQYVLALAILDRQGGMMPSARFAMVNYFRGGWHPLGFIGVGEAPEEAALKNVDFDSPAFLEKQILADGPGGSRVIRVTGDFGERSSLNHNFGDDARLDRGRYRFAFRVRGTPGQFVGFELADDWRLVSKEAQIPLTEQWQEHSIEFEIKTTFKDETTLRFSLPRDTKGAFDLTDTRLRVAK